jgi:hypothetical protein
MVKAYLCCLVEGNLNDQRMKRKTRETGEKGMFNFYALPFVFCVWLTATMVA